MRWCDKASEPCRTLLRCVRRKGGAEFMQNTSLNPRAGELPHTVT